MFRFLLVDDGARDVRFLGKSVFEFMLEGLKIPPITPNDRPVDFDWMGERATAFFDGAAPLPRESKGDVTVVLKLNMPLVTAEDISKVARRMRAKNIPSVRLGEENSASKIVLDDVDSGIFVNDDAFFEIYDAKSLALVYNLMRKRINGALLDRGVCILGEDGAHIDATVCVESGATIGPFSIIEGDSRIERGATVTSSRITDSVVESGASVEMSRLTSSRVRAGATVGPFARLRGADVGEGCRIGDFVEIKSSSLGGGVKAAHLAYIGDARVGDGTNIGCGTVFCNFDGKDKHRTDVGKHCFIGANANLVAPVSVGDGAFVAAGTTVTEDVPPNAFTIGRSRQNTKSR